MTNEELNTELYKKLFAEQEKFKGWLLTQPPDEILNHAYEYVMREDIVLALEYHDLSDERAKALLASPSPLDEVFHDFEKIEGDHMDTIRGCIESRADKNIEAQHEALRNLPVYIFSATFAKEHGELETYRASHRANVDCKNAIEDAIADHYRDNRLDTSCVNEVIDRFGMERVALVACVIGLDGTVGAAVADGHFTGVLLDLTDKAARTGVHTVLACIKGAVPGALFDQALVVCVSHKAADHTDAVGLRGNIHEGGDILNDRAVALKSVIGAVQTANRADDTANVIDLGVHDHIAVDGEVLDRTGSDLTEEANAVLGTFHVQTFYGVVLSVKDTSEIVVVLAGGADGGPGSSLKVDVRRQHRAGGSVHGVDMICKPEQLAAVGDLVNAVGVGIGGRLIMRLTGGGSAEAILIVIVGDIPLGVGISGLLTDLDFIHSLAAEDGIAVGADGLTPCSTQQVCNLTRCKLRFRFFYRARGGSEFRLGYDFAIITILNDIPTTIGSTNTSYRVHHVVCFSFAHDQLTIVCPTIHNGGRAVVASHGRNGDRICVGIRRSGDRTAYGVAVGQISTVSCHGTGVPAADCSIDNTQILDLCAAVIAISKQTLRAVADCGEIGDGMIVSVKSACILFLNR